MSKFAIATFCYGERYQKQVNRLISEIDKCEFKPTVVVVTDDTSKIINKSFVKVYDITQFNPEYKSYAETYYEFDFSVKRYSLLAAVNLGFTKVILCDADSVPNKTIFNEENILKGFVENSIVGQVTYNFSDQIITNSGLGKRFLAYEDYFKVSYDKNTLNYMPEDCIQFIDIEVSKFYNFLRVWDECIKCKKSFGLSNTPAGNIDEMCFSALNCGLSVGNNSDKVMNALIPIHDKWYDSAFEKKEEKKTIVTSVYELNYIPERGGGVYKGFDLLTQTIRNIIFNDYSYVIYTDKKTFEKHNLGQIFNFPNVQIKIKELNGIFYLNYLNPIKQRRIKEGEIWDRIHSVENYIEVIYNKIDFLIEEAKINNGELIWIDSGLFGTSCSNGWRDHMNKICHTKNFIDKIFEKINQNNFIALKGEHILINYEVREKINNAFKTSLKVIPGCLFGGKSELIIDYLNNYNEEVEESVNILSDYLSEQEILFLKLKDKNITYYEFDDWDDLQKAFLKIMNIYDESTYQKSSHNSKDEIIPSDLSITGFTKIADFFGIDKGSLHECHMYTEVYEKHMSKYLTQEPCIVEIGINDSRFPGGCLKFWNAIFDKMKYYGFDIADCSHLNYNQEKIKTFKGDQGNEKDLKDFVNYFEISNKIDIIIDDGSHEHDHIFTTFINLYPHLKLGGKYFVEDLHAGQALRSETLSKIRQYLENNYSGLYNFDDENYKLLIVEKL